MKSSRQPIAASYQQDSQHPRTKPARWSPLAATGQRLMAVRAFSTLESGLRDEIKPAADSRQPTASPQHPRTKPARWSPLTATGQRLTAVRAFSTLESGLRSETRRLQRELSRRKRLSVPSNRAYEVRRGIRSGSRAYGRAFQYPRIGPTK